MHPNRAVSALQQGTRRETLSTQEGGLLPHKDRLRRHQREETTAPLLRALLLEVCRDLDPFHDGIGVSVDDLPGPFFTAIEVRDA